MDTLIKNADIALDARGRPSAISGVDELLQRALIRLTVKKGSFPYDTELGSRLYTLRGGGDLRGEAEAFVREALAPMNELAVESVETAMSRGEDRLDVRVNLFVRGESRELEVSL